MNDITISFGKETIHIELSSGKKASHPLAWFPKLRNASFDELQQYELSPFGIHWPSLDEDLSFEGFFKFKGPTNTSKAKIQ